ncbi:MAG: DsbA family oxidoreductase [Actinomycetota bacterium]
MTAPVAFTIWSDFLCPWCYVAALRIHEVQRAVGDILRVEWRSFLLRPQPEDRPLDRFRRYTESWARPADAEPRAQFRVWEGDARPPTHSLPPAIAGKAAATFGLDTFDRFHVALMRAYFAENRTISDRAVILDVAAGVGLDSGALAIRLDADSDELMAAVVADQEDALSRGIAAVPTVVIDDEDVVTGALPTEAYSRIVDRRGG